MPAARSGRAVAVTLVVGVAVLIVVLVLALSDRDVHLAGTNNIFDRFPVAVLEPGDELCERAETVPAGAAAVQFSVGEGAGATGGPLAVRVLDGRRTVTRGERTGDWEGSTVDVPVDPVPETAADARVCVTNRGDAPVTLRGYGVDATRVGFTLRGEETNQEIRLTYLRGGSDSWWAMAGTVAHRFGIGRGELFGGWMAYAWLLGLLAMGAVAVGLVLRVARA